MEIDTLEKQMSRIMDKKVLAKAKKNDEEEIIFQNKRKLKEMKDKEKEDIEKEKQRKESKQKKQKVKDEKKRLRRKSIRAEKTVINKHNIKPIPNNISHLVNKGDVIYVVPGDGSCLPSSAAAFLRFLGPN